MTTKYTPGPWIFDKKDGSIATKHGSKLIAAGAYGYDIACSDADGVLMAASPELLDALEKARPFINAWPQCRDSKTPEVPGSGLLELIDSAIAKATG